MFISLLRKEEQSMNKNMRKMFTEEEIAQIILKAYNHNDIKLGSRLFVITRHYKLKSGQTVAEGCSTELELQFICIDRRLESKVLPWMTVVQFSNSISLSVYNITDDKKVTSLIVTSVTPPSSHLKVKCIDKLGAESEKELDIPGKYDVDVSFRIL